jgi:hypothetical protein
MCNGGFTFFCWPSFDGKIEDVDEPTWGNSERRLYHSACHWKVLNQRHKPWYEKNAAEIAYCDIPKRLDEWKREQS